MNFGDLSMIVHHSTIRIVEVTMCFISAKTYGEARYTSKAACLVEAYGPLCSPFAGQVELEYISEKMTNHKGGLVHFTGSSLPS